MSMTGGGATANVNIKVDVDDAGAEARLAALEKRLKALEQSSKGASGASKSFNNDLDSMSKTSKRLSGDHDKLAKTGETLKNMFGRLGKFAKFAGIEFLGFTAALAAMKLALVAGQYAMKGFHALLRGTGAAAGVAIAAIGTVLAAMRELQAATMAPLMGGMKESRSQMNAVYADRRFAMFDAKTMGSIIQSAASQGKTIDAAFRNQLARYADYAMGDPKKLAEIQKTMIQAEKDKKITAKTYAELQQSAPMLAKAFDEMAGGTAKGAAAAKAGTVSYQKFFAAVNEGKLKALLPFNGALEQINNTLIGRLKASFRGVKEQLTRLGEPFLKTFQGPINVVEREISTFVLKINGTLQKVFPTLFKIGDSNNNMITRMFDKLANSINANMANITGWGDKIKGMGIAIRNFFGGTGGALEKMTTGWNKLYKSVLKPIAKVIGENLVFAMTKFNGLIEGQSLDGFTTAIESFGDILHNVIDGLFQLKAVLAPILQMFLGLGTVVASLTGGPFKMLLPLLLMGKMMSGKGKMGGKGAAGAAGMGMMGAGPLGMLAMPLMMGMSGFGAKTQAAATSNTNYKANRAAGAGVLPAALLSGQRGGQFSQNMRSGMGFGTSLITGFSKGANSKYQEAYSEVESKHKRQFRQDRQNEFNNYVKNPALAGMTQGDLTDKHGNMLTKKQLVAKHGNEFGVRDATGLKLSTNEAQRAILDTMKGDAGSVLHERNDPARQQMIKDEATKAGKLQGKEFVKNSAKQFGKAAGGMAATVGASMLGAYITKKAGTNQGMAAAGGALSGAGTGASMGAAFGPWGMAIGALAGGVIGGISGWKNAKKLQEQQAKTSIGNVRKDVFGGKTFNTIEDFDAAREAAAGTQTNLDQLTAGSRTNLEGRIMEQKFKQTDARAAMQEEFRLYAMKETGASNVERQTGGAVDTFKFTGGKFDKRIMDSEDNRTEDLAAKFLKSKGASDAVIARMDGKGAGKGGFGVIDYFAGLQFDGNIEQMTQDLDALKEKYPDVAAATEEYKRALEEIEKKQKAFTENSTLASGITDSLGISMDQVADLFAKTGRSLSETLPGIKDFNKLIGMVGDTATRVANGAGRLGRALFAQTQSDMDIAESRSRLETQLQTMFATKGSLSASEGTRVAGETLNEVVNNSMAELSAGNIDFTQLAGADGKDGMLQNQLKALLDQAKKTGVSKTVVSQLENSIYGVADDKGVRSGGMLDKINNAKTDPFARMQFDGKFNKDFEDQMLVASQNAAAAMAGGASIDEAINAGTTDLAKFLQSQGIEVTPETMSKLQTMLGGTIQNSASAMQTALQVGGAYAADAIRAALTGAPPPAPPVTTTPGVPAVPVVPFQGPAYGGRPAGYGSTPPVDQGAGGDTTTSRFSRTLAAHSSFNAMTPGKRLVTSGIRNTNVGSMNSDHITGRAFDLTGDNLVSYSQNVKEAGGFAEFHGGPGEQRHLHVVPPVGDSSSPVAGGGGGGSTSNYYTIEVNAGAGMDEEALANKVLDKIKRAERTSSERR
jgi:hypothetical protein